MNPILMFIVLGAAAYGLYWEHHGGVPVGLKGGVPDPPLPGWTVQLQNVNNTSRQLYYSWDPTGAKLDRYVYDSGKWSVVVQPVGIAF